MATMPESLAKAYAGVLTRYLTKYPTLPEMPPICVLHDEPPPSEPIHELLWGRSFRVMPIQPLAVPEEPIRDDHANKPDDTLLPLDEWNAKVDAMIAEWVAMQTRGV